MRSLGTTSVLPSRTPHRHKARSRTPTNIRTPRTASTLPNPAVRLPPTAPTSAKQRSPAAPTSTVRFHQPRRLQPRGRPAKAFPASPPRARKTGPLLAGRRDAATSGRSVPPLVRVQRRPLERSAVRRGCPNGSRRGRARRTRSRLPHGRSRTCRARGGQSRSTSAMHPRPGSRGRGRRRR